MTGVPFATASKAINWAIFSGCMPLLYITLACPSPWDSGT
jgi:hypothetical protein